MVYQIYRRNSFFNFFNTTTRLILFNLLVYFLLLVIFSIYGENAVLKYFAITPNSILQGENLWTLITSMFSHIFIFHLFVNMFSLFFIGNFLEKIIGGKRLFLVYFVSGIIGAVFFVLSGAFFNNNTPGLGASGAIFGILGVLAVLIPKSKIYLITGPLVLILIQAIIEGVVPANFLSVLSLIFSLLFFVMIFSMLSFNPAIRKIALPIELKMWLLPIVAIVPLVLIGFFVSLPIGNSAHIGGLLVGLVYGFYLRKRFPNKTRILSRHFS